MSDYEKAYKEKGILMPREKHDAAFKALGGVVWWPRVERNCAKFTRETNDY
jgi:hypothetical protein